MRLSAAEIGIIAGCGVVFVGGLVYLLVFGIRRRQPVIQYVAVPMMTQPPNTAFVAPPEAVPPEADAADLVAGDVEPEATVDAVDSEDAADEADVPSPDEPPDPEAPPES